jgi:hypothetical protein
VISPDTGKGQRLLHIFEQVTPKGHAEEVFALLKENGWAGAKSGSTSGARN